MNIILKILIFLVFASLVALLTQDTLRPRLKLKNGFNLSHHFDYSGTFSSQAEEIKWLTDNDNAQAWYSYAIWKLNSTTLANHSRNIYNQPLIWRTNDFPPLHWYRSKNDTILIAISIYSMGPALNPMEPEIPDNYYIACGNGLIKMFLFAKGDHCSLRQQYSYIGWNYMCYVYSFFYEIERTATVRGMFGVNQLNAFIMFGTPYLAVILVMGCMNYITMGRVMRKVDAGPTLYHRFEIGCGIVFAVICMIRDQDCSVIADWLMFKFTGFCLSSKAIATWSSVHYMLVNQLNDSGVLALALLANDRYQAFCNPIKQMAAKKRPGRHLAAATMLVASATGLRLIADSLQQYKIMNEVSTIVATGVSDFIRTGYLSVCLFVTIRCSIGITGKILLENTSENSIEFKNVERDDRLRRTAALTLQTCILSSLSILTSAIGSFLKFLYCALKLFNHYEAADMLLYIYSSYFCSPQYFVVCISSNTVFIIHCYYSKLYREAMYETHAAVKAGLKRIADSVGCLKC